MILQKRQLSIALLIALTLSLALGAADADAARHSKSLSLDVGACIAKIGSQVSVNVRHKLVTQTGGIQD